MHLGHGCRYKVCMCHFSAIQHPSSLYLLPGPSSTILKVKKSTHDKLNNNNNNNLLKDIEIERFMGTLVHNLHRFIRHQFGSPNSICTGLGMGPCFSVETAWSPSGRIYQSISWHVEQNIKILWSSMYKINAYFLYSCIIVCIYTVYMYVHCVGNRWHLKMDGVFISISHENCKYSIVQNRHFW